ncbi:MAG TPA: hypothetical protein VF681_10415 [Abditibacteriaceae bacterium]|jgi:hypothetical protein
MYRRALRFAAVGVLTAAVLLIGSQAFAAESSLSSVSSKPLEISQPVPADVTISLRFLTDAVAGGAFATPVHQAEFEVRAVDSKGKPRRGVEVSLPLVISGGKGVPKEGVAEVVTARVAWGATSERTGQTTAITDRNGIARGIFTSGNRVDEAVVLQVPGTKATAEISQLWYDCGAWDGGWQEQSDDSITNRFVLRLVRDGVGPNGKPVRVSIPITGHPMRFVASAFQIEHTNTALGPDDDNDGKQDGAQETKTLSSRDDDPTEWKRLQQYFEVDKVTEVEPGVYNVTIKWKVPKNDEGEAIFSVLAVYGTLWDDSIYGLKGIKTDVPPGTSIEN